MMPSYRDKSLEEISKIAKKLNKNGNQAPNIDDIATELDQLHGPGTKYLFAGDQISAKEYVRFNISYIRSHLLNYHGITIIPIRFMYYIDKPKLKSAAHAKHYLSGAGHPTYGVYFHKGEHDYLYQAQYNKGVDRMINAREKNIEFLITSTEEGAISKDIAIELLSEANAELEHQITRNSQLIAFIKGSGSNGLLPKPKKT
jgi:hypothetical protein